MASLVVRFAWCCFVDCFIHKNGNDSAGVTAPWRAHDSTEDAEPMCALSRRQSRLGEEGTLVRLEASPGLWLGVLSRGDPSPREKSLARLRQAWEPLQAWRAWSLAKFPDELCGPWQAGPWYPGFHCADSSPRAHDGHAEVVDGGEASRARKMHVWAATHGA